MGWLIGCVISGSMVLFGIMATTESLNTGEALVNNAMVTILMLLLSMWFFKKYRLTKNPEYETARKKKAGEALTKLQSIPGSKARKELLGATTYIYAKHMTGLPLAEGADCSVYLCPDKVIFERNETSYNLLADKVTDVLIKTDAEIQKSYVSSAGGAVAGGMLFGALGAIIGGMAKEKTSKVEYKYLIFAYEKDNTTDYISFDVTNILDAYKFVNHFAKRPKERKEVTL